jgi:hypothetical protein
LTNAKATAAEEHVEEAPCRVMDGVLKWLPEALEQEVWEYIAGSVEKTWALR